MSSRKKDIFLFISAIIFTTGMVLAVYFIGNAPSKNAGAEVTKSESSISEGTRSIAIFPENVQTDSGLLNSVTTEIPLTNTDALEPVMRSVNGINIIIDPRIELLAAVQLISGYDKRFGLITREEFDYKKAVKKHFTPYSNHPAVKIFNKMSSKGFSFDAPPTAMLYLSNPPDLLVTSDFSEYIVRRAGKTDLYQFIVDLRNFALESGYNNFYMGNYSFYTSVLDKNAAIIKSNQLIEQLESYFGMKQKSYNIILSPLFHSGGFGPKMENADGTFDIYSIEGPSMIEKGIPVFGSENSYKNLVWHEFSHSFVNPLTDKHMTEINKYEKLYTPIADKMKKQAYGEWLTCVNEHIVRAIGCRLTYLHDGEDAYKIVLANEKRNGFVYEDKLVEKLMDFENNREKYKSLEDFYPEILKVFKELSENKPETE